MLRRAAWGAALLAAVRAVTVLQLRLEYGSPLELPLNSSVEYILDFVPLAGEESASVPAVLQLASSGGDVAHPVLVTARQRAGVTTWQLPYEVDGRQTWQLQRTLCPDDSARCTTSPQCEPGAGEGGARGGFSLHVSSSCSAELVVRVEASLPPVWRLPFAEPVILAATEVVYYQFLEDQDSARLELQSDDDVCASVSIQNYSCPIAQTLADISAGAAGLRMTMQRSGAVQLSRRQFPRGFLMVMAVHPTQAACLSASPARSNWLWEGVVLGEPHDTPAPPAHGKNYTVQIEAALSRAQYAAAIAVTVTLFLAFYVAFGALVLAQRWPPFGDLVRPKAVLADVTAVEIMPAQTNGSAAAEQVSVPAQTHAQGKRRRRTSVDTFDSSDGSSSEEEQTAAPESAADVSGTTATAGTTTIPGTTATPGTPHTASDPAVTPVPPPLSNGQTASANERGPFGLPAQLTLAGLAKRRERTLRSRSDRYFYTLATVAVFYALPALQFVAVIKIILNVSGSLDICYYNFLCAHPAGVLSDFNHVLSNAGYLLLGALFMLQEYGIPAHYGLLSALGAAMMVVAVLSASYHVCPNKINFQFDTAFMFVLAVLSMVKIYQSRHPDVNARAHSTFGVLAVIIAIVVWGVLGGGPLFWALWTVLHLFTFLLLSLRIYYVGQFRLEKESLQEAARELRRSPRPLYSTRLAMLLLGNAVNWMFAIYGLVQQSSDFAGHMLQVLLGNTLLHMVSYLVLKLVQRERLRWYAWCWLGGAAAAWVPALYFFLSGSSDWSAAPAASRHRNHHCMVMEFYDSHDLWHILSAVALYFSFNAMLTWDDGLSAVKKTDIPVF